MTTAGTIERNLAELSIEILRSAGVADEEILRDYTTLRPQADRAYERAYREEHGRRIRATAVKAHMRTLLGPVQ